MLNDNITLNTTDEYRLQVRNPTSSIRSMAGLPLGKNQVLKVSHETANDGAVSSVFIRENTVVDTSDTSLPVTSVKAHFKVQYDPTVSHVDLAAELTLLASDIAELLADPAVLTAFFNKEH